MMHPSAFVGSVCLATAIMVQPLSAAKRSDEVVKVRATADPTSPQGLRRVIISLAVERGWHIYANPAGPEELRDAQTSIALIGPSSMRIESVGYPQGIEKRNEIVGTYRVYQGEVSIPVTLRPTSESDDVPRLVVRFQACSDRACLPLAEMQVPLPTSR
jgi:DsbC/DsbD-like thiol-disulfide interchange protein